MVLMFVKIILLSAFAVLACLTSPLPEGQTYGSSEEDTVTFKEKKFWFSKQKATWHQSLSNCKSQNQDLATIRTPFEQIKIEHAVEEEGLTNIEFWIGGNDIQSEGIWRWFGPRTETALFTNWQDDEPNNLFNNEDCLTLTADFHWNDLYCDLKRYYICEYFE